MRLLLIIAAICCVCLAVVCVAFVKYIQKEWYTWHTVASVFNDDYHVVARIQDTDATTPGATALFLLKSGYESRGETELMSFVKSKRKAKLEIVRDRYLFASIFGNTLSLHKIYSILDLEKPPDNLTIWSDDMLIHGQTLDSVFSGQWSISANRIKRFQGLVEITMTHLSPEYRDEILVMGADSVQLSLADEQALCVAITWLNDDGVEGLCFDLPESPVGFVKAQ